MVILKANVLYSISGLNCLWKKGLRHTDLFSVQGTPVTTCVWRSQYETAWCWSRSGWSTIWPSATTPSSSEIPSTKPSWWGEICRNTAANHRMLWGCCSVSLLLHVCRSLFKWKSRPASAESNDYIFILMFYMNVYCSKSLIGWFDSCITKQVYRCSCLRPLWVLLHHCLYSTFTWKMGLGE